MHDVNHQSTNAQPSMYNECYCILLGKILILQYVVISLLLPEMYDMPANEIQLDRVSNAVNSTASTTQKQTPSNMSQLNLQAVSYTHLTLPTNREV